MSAAIFERVAAKANAGGLPISVAGVEEIDRLLMEERPDVIRRGVLSGSSTTRLGGGNGRRDARQAAEEASTGHVRTHDGAAST